MTRAIQMNYKGDPLLKANGLKCVSCGSQEHVMECDGCKALRKGKALREDQELVNFFREVIKLGS